MKRKMFWFWVVGTVFAILSAGTLGFIPLIFEKQIKDLNDKREHALMKAKEMQDLIPRFEAAQFSAEAIYNQWDATNRQDTILEMKMLQKMREILPYMAYDTKDSDLSWTWKQMDFDQLNKEKYRLSYKFGLKFLEYTKESADAYKQAEKFYQSKTKVTSIALFFQVLGLVFIFGADFMLRHRDI